MQYKLHYPNARTGRSLPPNYKSKQIRNQNVEDYERQINVLLEVLEEIKQQNRELKTSISNLPQPTESQGEIENRKNLAGIAKILEEQLEFHRQFREELCQVIVKLGKRIHEMKSSIAEVRIS